MEKCPACNNEIKDDFNVCPYCLEPLNDMAKKLFLEKEKSAQLKLLSALIEKANDEKTLKTYKNLVEMITKKWRGILHFFIQFLHFHTRCQSMKKFAICHLI